MTCTKHLVANLEIDLIIWLKTQRLSNFWTKCPKPESRLWKSLKIPVKELTAFLSKNKWIYKRGSNWVGYQTKTNSGHLEHNINFVNKDRFSSHSDVFFVQVMLTAKGIVKVAEMLESQFA